MKVHAHFQQKTGGDPTAEWQKIRTGCLTASEFGEFVDLSGKHRTGEKPKSYMAEKLFERWTGRQKPNEFFSMAVNNGIIVEEKAAAFAALEYGLDIQHVGFVSNDDETLGASPDGLIGWGGIFTDKPTFYGEILDRFSGIEIKAPALYTHIKWQMDGTLPDAHLCQVQGSMWVTGCQTWHFLSYPLACYLDGFPPLHLVVERDEEWQKNFGDAVAKFQAKFEAEWKKLVDRNGGLPKRFTAKPEPKPYVAGIDHLAGA